MAAFAFGGIEVPLPRRRHTTKSYYLKIRFSDSETPEDKVRVFGSYLSKLLSDVDIEDVDLDGLSKDMRRRVKWDGAESIVPHCRQDLTNEVLKHALLAAEESITFEGELESIRQIEVQERETVRDAFNGEGFQ